MGNPIAQILVAAIAVSLPSALLGQEPPRLWASAASGIGGSGSTGSLYKGSPNYIVRGAIGFGLTRRLGIEGSREVVHGWGRGDYACVGGRPCPAHFDLKGVAGSIVINAGPTRDPARLRILLGAGAYRVTNDFPYTPSIPELTVTGVTAGIEFLVWRRAIGDLAIGLQPIVIPSVNGTRLWVIPIVLKARLK